MSSSLRIITGSHGGASLCERCAKESSINDSDSEFHEDVRVDGKPTLRHKNEQTASLRLPPVIRWIDSSPEYSTMKASHEAGCELCGFVRKALIRRNISYRGQVTIMCGYIWGANRDSYDPKSQRDDGLVYMRCEVSAAGKSLAFIVFPIYSKNEDIMCWLRTDDLRAKEPLGPENVKWIKSELWSCDNDCDHTLPQSTFLPTRLIDVGEEGRIDPRLVVTADLIRNVSSPIEIKYASLSYCWGPKEDAGKQLKTTPSTFDLHCQGIQPETMTQVVRDTVQVCRALGITHVWIDALCIIQEDVEDWDRESEMMGLIYYHAYLTICPLSSHSCLQTFLGQRHRGLSLDFQSKLHSNIRGALTLYESHNDNDVKNMYKNVDWSMDILPPLELDKFRSSWQTRGWTFQEDSFSSRFLYFGKSMLHFTCEGWQVSENSFVTQGPGIVSPLRELIDISKSQDHSEETKQRASTIWGMLNAIQGRHFTYRTDFFPSIAGLAKACSDILQDTYLAGLWQGNLHFELLWVIALPLPGDLDSVVGALEHPDLYLAPSWSWASQRQYFDICAPLSYEIPGTTKPLLKGKKYTECAVLPSHIRQQITLVDCQVDLEGYSPYGKVKSAFLLLRGKLAPFPSDVIMQPSLSGRSPFGYFAEKLGTVMLDWSVSDKTMQEGRGMVMLLTASCCQATSNLKMRWYSNPEEDHTETLSLPDCSTDQDGINSADDCENEAPTCSSCRDEFHGRNLWGIVLHPAPKFETYFRVGAFVLFGSSGAAKIFGTAVEHMVKII